MNKKLVFFDLDGTLLNSEKKIPQTTKDAIKQLRENGIDPVIATGRPPVLFDWIREELDLHNFVSTNGQYVQFNDEIIHENIIEKEQLEKLVSDAKSRGHHMAFYNHETFISNNIDHPYVIESFNSFNDALPTLDEEFHLNEKVHQAILFCTSEEEDYYRENYPEFDFIRWHPYALDVLPKGGSKASGIRALLEKLNVSTENTYAFGDGLNDVAMFELVQNGIAMDNAHDDLKKVASHITKNCDEDGILCGLKHYKLLGE